MDVASPKNGFVIKVSVDDGNTVKAGDELLEMDSDWEQTALERIRFQDAMRELNAARYTDEQLGLLRSIAKAAVDAAEAQLSLVERQSAEDNARMRLDENADPALVKLAENARVAQATFDRDRAQTNQTQLEYAIGRIGKANDSAKVLSATYVAAINKRIERLKIMAPVSGHVKLNVRQGSFAKLGSIMLEIR
jgi:multidrug resistance efflux pump